MHLLHIKRESLEEFIGDLDQLEFNLSYTSTPIMSRSETVSL